MTIHAIAPIAEHTDGETLVRVQGLWRSRRTGRPVCIDLGQALPALKPRPDPLWLRAWRWINEPLKP
jgi:hypothetical protein